MTAVGEIVETRRSSGKLSFEWRIPNFFRCGKIDGYKRLIPNYPQSGLISDRCLSPPFSFCNDTWTLGYDTDIYNYKLAQLGLYFYRINFWGPSRTVRYTFAIKAANGKLVKRVYYEQDFEGEEGAGLSWPDFWSMSYLRKNRSRLVPDNVLTIIGVFKSAEPRISLPYHSTYRRDMNIRPKSRPTEEGSPPDFTLKAGNREWPVHKRILGSSSEYFATMFGREEWSENSEGSVRFDDIKEDTLDCILKFIYTGQLKDVLLNRVCDIYIAAHKFLLEDLKKLCIYALTDDDLMGPGIFWEALAIAKIYEEKDLRECALQFIDMRDMRKACMWEWKHFEQNHPSIAAEVLNEINGDCEEESEEV